MVFPNPKQGLLFKQPNAVRCYCKARQICISSKVVRGAGLEPAQYCYRQDLNLVRLPISPPARLKRKWESGLPREHSKPCQIPAKIGKLAILACNACAAPTQPARCGTDPAGPAWRVITALR
jgi:hypothetical protein